MEAISSATKRQTGNIIHRRQSTSRKESAKLKVSITTVKTYVYKIRKGIPIFESGGRPPLLDNDHFNELVQYVGKLPQKMCQEINHYSLNIAN